MNLKEAFRFQNKLQQMVDMAESILGYEENVVQTETTYFRKKVMAGLEDEVVLSDPATPFAGQINELAEFLMELLRQRASLAEAVRKAKAGMDVDMDMESGLNKERRSAAAVFRDMAGLRASEVLIPGGGSGYRFNAEGNQVSYRCDIKRVTTINFDRNKVRKLAAKLFAEADAASAKMDLALIGAQVDFQPPFDVNATFEDVFEEFVQRR